MNNHESKIRSDRSLDFIVIGPGRSGSTFLYKVCLEHPEICMPLKTKETNFFNHEYQRGLSWYVSFFKNCDPNKIIGEISNTYIYDELVPERIYETYPDIKLIAVLRNPFQRIVSAFEFRKSVGEIRPNTSFQNALALFPDLITDNFYGSQLSRYFKLFPNSNILIAFYDDLEQSPGSFLKDFFEFLQVDPDFHSDIISKRVNQSKTLKFPFIAPLVRFMADTLRKLQLFGLLKKSKDSAFIRRLLFDELVKSTRVENLPAEIIDQLRKVFIPEIIKIEDLTKRDLTHWYN